jgi:Ca-activated chloride channel family protein
MHFQKECFFQHQQGEHLMKTLNQIFSSLTILLFAILWNTAAHAAGLLTPTGSGHAPLEIMEHHVEVVIEDGYAITTVEQVFGNPNGEDLEAVYSFPVPENAAVGEFAFWIDGQAVTGEVLEKQQAREIYEQEKQAGREAAITEQDAYRAFDISVYPVRAGQDAYVRLTYIQPVHVDSSVGRYVYPLEEGGVDEERLSFWTYQEAVRERFSFNLEFRSSWPVDEFRLPQHPQAMIQQTSGNEWQVTLANEHQASDEGVQEQAGNRVVRRLDQDVVVYWRQAQDLPGSVELVAHKEQARGRGTFMMTLTPGDDLAPITRGRDWVFVLDFSGSMEGKFRSLVEGVERGLASLNPNDRFRIILFNNKAREITRSFEPATPETVQHYISIIAALHPENGTNLYAGLEMGMNLLDADRSSALVLVTDGVANVGLTQRRDFLDLLDRHDARLFTFVMGNSANRPLLEGMAKASNGFAMNVSNGDEIAGKLMEATSRLTHEAFHDVDVRFSGAKVGDLTPGRIGSLYRGQQLIIFGHYWGGGEARVTVDGLVAGQGHSYSTIFEFPETATQHPEIERLWAFAKIEDLQGRLNYFGEGADIEQAITDVAVENGLVTNYTSMIVLREERFAELGIDRLNMARVAKEQLARQERVVQSVRDNRVDQQQPMYSQPRSSHGNGGGSLGPWMLLLLLPLLWRRFERKAQQK